MNENNIEMYLHCGLCLDELSTGNIQQSPQEYQRIQAGWTKQGIQLVCTRHGSNIIHIDFEGAKHPADTTTPDPNKKKITIN